MTILPKKKTSAPKSERDSNNDRVDPVAFPPRGIPQGQAVVSGNNAASGWGPGVGPTSGASGWSPPGPVSGPAPHWEIRNPGSSVVSPSAGVAGEKKRSTTGPNYDFEDGGPSANKRRLIEPPSPQEAEEEEEEEAGGYNSEDEYNHLGVQLTEEEWLEKDRKFQLIMQKKGYVIKAMVEDGSCLFRAVADQLYGDQEMHGIVRKHCMDYIAQNADYFSHYVTEDIEDYVARKRYVGVHGNHPEIQALSEMYNRHIHIYCYSSEPINIFQGISNSENINEPIRLSYHRLCHYNSLFNPYKPSVGVGLGLPGYSPKSPIDRTQVKQAVKASEADLVERAMLEDKIRATDWEATNEAIEEQVARESYLQWLRDNERRHGGKLPSKSATVTSADLRAEASAASTGNAVKEEEKAAARSSPKPSCSHSSEPPKAAASHFSSSSPKAGCSSQQDSPKPCSSQQHNAEQQSSGTDYGLGNGFELAETASFLNRLPPNMFGLEDWADTDVLAQVLAESQQEYLDSLKKSADSTGKNDAENTKPKIRSRQNSSDERAPKD